MIPYGLILKGGLALGKHLLGAHLPQQLASLSATGSKFQSWETVVAAGGWRFAVGASVAAYWLNPGIRAAMDGLVVAVGKAVL